MEGEISQERVDFEELRMKVGGDESVGNQWI
jgi:hypothetical protein